MANSAGIRGGLPTEASIAELAELVRQLPEKMSQLAHQEVEHVKTDLEPKVKRVETDLELLKQLPDHIRQVVHQEVELVRAEMGELVKQQSEHISQEVERVKTELEPKVKRVETDLGLLKQLPEHLRQVAHGEVELVRAELEAKVRGVEIGLGMFAGAGAIAFYALGVMVAAVVLGLATAVTAWLSALIVAVTLVAIAGLLVVGGNSKMHESSHRKPS